MENSLVENVDGKLVVSSRDVAENFKKRHADVLEKIKTLSAEIQPTEKSAGYFIPTEYCDNKGENRPEYLLTRDGFSLLVMGFTGKEALDWKLKYIEAFNKMEATLTSQNVKRLPATYKEALQELLVQVEENERLLAENNELSPKAEYHDDVLNKAGLILMSVVAKDLGFPSATELNRIMYQNGIIFRQDGVWKPYAKYEWLIQDGYADYQSYTSKNSNPLLKWTEKGRKWIAENIEQWKVAV
jgi:Rha family phage regulatory protein